MIPLCLLAAILVCAFTIYVWDRGYVAGQEDLLEEMRRPAPDWAEPEVGGQRTEVSQKNGGRNI